MCVVFIKEDGRSWERERERRRKAVDGGEDGAVIMRRVLADV